MHFTKISISKLLHKNKAIATPYQLPSTMVSVFILVDSLVGQNKFVQFDTKTLKTVGVYKNMLPFVINLVEPLAEPCQRNCIIFEEDGVNNDRYLIYQPYDLIDEPILYLKKKDHFYSIIEKDDSNINSFFVYKMKNEYFLLLKHNTPSTKSYFTLLSSNVQNNKIEIDNTHATKLKLKKMFQSRMKRSRMSSEDYAVEYLQKKKRKIDVNPYQQFENEISSKWIPCFCCKRLFQQCNMFVLKEQSQKWHCKQFKK